jgi:hypothetical protein
MSQKSVTFIIGNGDVTIEANGFTGSACEVATKGFEEVLGGNVVSKQRKFETEKVATVAIGGKKS